MYRPIESVLKDTPDLLKYKEVVDRVESPLVAMETPKHSQMVCFWGEEDTYGHVECEYGQGVRLKTRGDSVLIGRRDQLMGVA